MSIVRKIETGIETTLVNIEVVEMDTEMTATTIVDKIEEVILTVLAIITIIEITEMMNS